jgi:hypothetical protein
LELLIEALWKHLGRYPTQNEIMVFVMGTHQNRLDIWNQSGSWAEDL